MTVIGGAVLVTVPGSGGGEAGSVELGDGGGALGGEPAIVVVGGAAVGLGFGPGRLLRITAIVTTSTITAMMAATTATMAGHRIARESTTIVVGGFGTS